MRKSIGLYDVSIWKILPFLSLPLALYLFIVVAPLVGAIYYSMNSVVGSTLHWIGFGNYAQLLDDPIFWLSLKNNFILILVSIMFQLGPAFVIMALMAADLAHFKDTVRSIFFFPCVIAPVVIGYIWRVMYNPEFGLINQTLSAFGLHSLEKNWLGDPKTIMLSVSLPMAWQYIGFFLVILLAGYTSINPDLVEAAEIDGASPSQRTRYVVWPLLRNTVNICVLLCVAGGLKIFDQIYALSDGGPGYSSTVLALYAYIQSFIQTSFGYGTTISIFVFLVGLLVVSLLMLVRRSESYND